MEANQTMIQEIAVTWNFPVIFTRGLFQPGNTVLSDTLCRLREDRRHKAMVFVDSNVATATPGILADLSSYFARHAKELELASTVQLVPGGELAKNDFRLVEGFMRVLLEAHMDRHSYVIIVGGGAVMDAVGLAAALVHRGLRQVRVPTTVLGQNDAGVGVKNGVNYLGGKNAIGTFAPPFAVLNDLNFLDTLSPRDYLCGVAEAFKVSIIKDAEFFGWLCDHAGDFPARSTSSMAHLVMKCAELHLHHIRTNGDPFEYGRARPLDFGHWSAHKLELLSNFQISHGEAVASGVLLDSIYAAAMGWITPEDLARIRSGLQRAGFQLWFQEYALQREGSRLIFDGLKEFREHLGGELTVTFPLGIGARHEVHEIDIAKMEAALQQLRY